MARRDYYNVLGIDRGTSQEAIKKAYRKLAMRWHPDRNPGDASAEQRFKDITEAYRVLGDPEERARYDRLGPLYSSDGRPPRPDELNEIMGSMVGNLFRRRRRDDPGEDLRYTLSLSLEDVASGVDKEIIVPRRIRCRTCGGIGAAPDGGQEKCPVCTGTGKSRGNLLFRTECYHCDGKGHVIVEPCDGCDGAGLVRIEDPLLVKVPSGVATGQKLKLKGKGDSARGNARDGDLFVIVNVSDHPLFTRRGDDLLATLPLSYRELVVGADVAVPTLDGSTQIRIPPGTPTGRIFRLANRGLPHVGRGGRGDLHYEVELEIPQNLSDSERDGLTGWADALPQECHPRRAAFDEAVRERS